ncbi:transcriptional regulator, HxlR family [Pedobacter antarcticus]|nr:transcriptional regulator, HxlR family [Pedobacter antarcticus]SFF21393.1 transcriptional regulator, HxlR family [Pedobacter antarcticus]
MLNSDAYLKQSILDKFVLTLLIKYAYMKSKIRVSENKICPLEHAVNTISGKWKIPIVWHLHHGIKKPTDFYSKIAGINRRVLTRQLKEMEESGIINKTITRLKPLEVEYQLTSVGDQLVQSLWSLNNWGEVLLQEKIVR